MFLYYITMLLFDAESMYLQYKCDLFQSETTIEGLIPGSVTGI